MLPRLWLTCVLALTLSAQEIETQQVVSGLSSPVDIQNANDNSGRLFIVEQPGRIRIVRDGQLENQPFLNIQDRVQSGSERGLLGLAFPPGFSQSQRFYVNYTRAGGDTVVSMFSVTGDPDVADAGSEVVLLTIEQPFSNHNGGQLQFGPGGLLFIATGDGGSGGDPFNAAQDLTSLLGKILRVDVESSPGTLEVPSGNPFVDTPGAHGEIWAFGLRNPWRFSFDQGSNDLRIADVGQSNFEEVNRRNSGSGGDNYGWRRMEGSVCFDPGCDPSGLILPVHSYSHGQGCSVTGGYVYRGREFDGLRGTYIYGDFESQFFGVAAANLPMLESPRDFGSPFGSCRVLLGSIGAGHHDPTPKDMIVNPESELMIEGPAGEMSILLQGIDRYEASLGGGFGGEALPEFYVPGVYNLRGPSGGTGASPIESFEATVSIPDGFEWLNAASVSNIARNQSLTVQWSGANAATEFVTISVQSTNNELGVAGVVYCTAPAEAGTFTVPQRALSTLPTSSPWDGEGDPTGFVSVATETRNSVGQMIAAGLTGGRFLYSNRNVSTIVVE